MGMGGKSAGKPVISQVDCLQCGVCADACPADAIQYDEAEQRYVITAGCMECGKCMALCDVSAINIKEEK